MAKNSKEYWQERMLLEEEAVRKNADRYLQTLQKEYKAGIKSLDDELKRFYELYATENGVSAAQIRKPLSREEWLRYEEQVTELLKENGMHQDRKARNRYLSGRISRLQALQNQAELELEKLGFNHNGTLTKHLHETYEDSYYHTVYNFGQVGITGRFDRLNPRKVEQICKVEWSGKSFSSRVWDNTAKLKREVKRLLSTGSICGTPVRVLSQRLAERMNVSYHRAETLVRTESAQISARATADGYEKSGVEKYRILATLDNRTSSICRSLDGKVFLLSEKVTGETYPPFHPNCRTTTVPEFDDFKINSTRAAKDKDNNRLEVPVGMKYPEWYQKYVLEEPQKTMSRTIPVKGLSADDVSLQSYIEKELSLIPVRHLEHLCDYVKEIEVVDQRTGAFNPVTKSIQIPREAIEEDGLIIHELGHALDSSFDLSHNTEYQDIINRVFSGADDFRNIEIDTESFEVPVLYFKGNEDIFVSEYQRRLYMDEDVVDENDNIKAVAVQEYFAEGYREFVLNEQVLAEKDAVLYEFIKGLIE